MRMISEPVVQSTYVSRVLYHLARTMAGHIEELELV